MIKNFPRAIIAPDMARLKELVQDKLFSQQMESLMYGIILSSRPWRRNLIEAKTDYFDVSVHIEVATLVPDEAHKTLAIQKLYIKMYALGRDGKQLAAIDFALKREDFMSIAKSCVNEFVRKIIDR